MASLLEGLAEALGPTVLGLAGDFGVTLSRFAVVDTEAADGSPLRAYTAAGTVTGFLRPLNATARERLFGVRSSATAALILPRQAAGLPNVGAREGFTVTGTGVLAGGKWVALEPGVPDPAGLTITVPLTTAPPGLF
jgi:hypothetical protein